MPLYCDDRVNQVGLKILEKEVANWDPFSRRGHEATAVRRLPGRLARAQSVVTSPMIKESGTAARLSKSTLAFAAKSSIEELMIS